MIYWLLAREVLVLRGELRHDEDWDIFVDLFYHKEISNEQLAETGHKDADVEAGEEAVEGKKEGVVW